MNGQWERRYLEVPRTFPGKLVIQSPVGLMSPKPVCVCVGGVWLVVDGTGSSKGTSPGFHPLVGLLHREPSLNRSRGQ